VAAQQEILSIISSGHHPNIVEVIDTWLEQNSYFTTFYIQMELCEGDLHDFLQKRYSRGNLLSSNEIWDTFRQFMNGVEYIHLQDIVHGDLKPKNSTTIQLFANLVLYKRDNRGELVWKITDFGVSSRKYFPPLTFGRMTRNYCAPEFLIASRYTKKMDIWSAGCILYELATALPLFQSDEEIRKYAWSGTSIPKVSSFREDLSSADEFVGSMLNISLEMRPEATSILRDIPKEKTINENIDFPIAQHAIQKIQGYENLGDNRILARMDGKHELVIVESHPVLQHSTHLHSDILKLVHVLKLLYDIPQCHIPRCLGFMNAHDHYSLVYSNPTPLIPEEWDCYSLEHVLSTPHCTAHQELCNPLSKVQLALSLAKTLEKVHVAGYTHQSLGAHNILYQPNASSIVGFSLQILQSIQTPPNSTTMEWRERLYQHPQIRTGEATIYKPEYDYYALGVILLEIGRMESFASARGSLKREDENLDPQRLQGFRIARAKGLDYVAEKYADVVVKCLVADFGEGDKNDVIQTFREEVCDVLEGIVSSLKGLRLRVIGV
jgi:serine/threonine protein kinase